MEGKWEVFVKELKMVSFLSAPMVAVSVLQYSLPFVTLMMVGYLDELSLSAFSFTIVTGYSLICGMAGALETLCGQTYGAEQYKKLGIYTYAAIISLILVCIPISILWMFTDKLLILIGQDPTISHIAHKDCICLVPNLFAYAILQQLVRYYQTQSLILPLLFSSFAALCFHIPFCWTPVFKLKLGSSAAALASASSYLLDVLMLDAWGIHEDFFFSMREFFRFAVPSAGMVCLEWWSFEGLVLLSRLLPNPELETSVLSLCLTITNLQYYIPYGFAATARFALKFAIMVLVVAEMVFVAVILIFCHRVLGYAFSSKKETVDRIADMGPLLCLSIIMDGLWVARGSGWQDIGAYVNLGAYYLVGVPVGVVLAFVVHLKGKAFLLALKTSFTNWEKQASKARERIFDGDI
ncbi:hypothetical protein ACJW31_12G009400 [Castanea mollissima]